MDRIIDSAVYLAEHIGEVPVMVIPCLLMRVPEGAGVMDTSGFYGSILPAAWSFMLALRSRGLGSAWTTLHLAHEAEAAELLGIPDTVTQTLLIHAYRRISIEHQFAAIEQQHSIANCGDHFHGVSYEQNRGSPIV